MRSLLKLNKFNRRYEIDLFGNIGLSHNFKMLQFIKNIKIEKKRRRPLTGRRRTYRYYQKKVRRAYRVISPKVEPHYLNFFKNKDPYSARSTFVNQINYRRNNRRKFRHKFMFVYRIDIEQPRRKRLKTTLSRDLFLVNRKLRSFYANIKRLQLRRYANNFKFSFKTKQLRGLNLNNFIKFKNKNYYSKVKIIDSFLSVLERRLDMFLYRSNFAISVFQSRHLILHNKVLVNFKTVSFCSYQLRNFEVVMLKPKFLLRLRNRLKKKLSMKLLLGYFPSYLIISYKLMCGFFIKNPTLKSVPIPFKINLSQWLGLAKMDV